MKSDRKKTRQFRLRCIVFFNKDEGQNLLQLGKKEIDEEIMDAEGETLILMNHKSG